MGKVTKIDANLLLAILSNGLGLEKNNLDGVGEVICLPPRQALSYAIITSHGYLDEDEPDNLFKLTRDNFRVFNQAQEFQLQEGVFARSGLRFFTTVNLEIKRKPYIATGEKCILPLEYSDYDDLKKKINSLIMKIKSVKKDIHDFIIAPIRNSSSSVSEFESFFEYVVSVYFNRRNYLTDTQIPFFYGQGTPDIAAYKIPKLMTLLVKYGFLEDGGNIVDLMSVSSFGFHNTDSNVDKVNDSIVFDVKTTQSSAPQIMKYTETKIFEKAYEVIPVLKEPERYAGLISVDNDGKILVSESKEPIPFDKTTQQQYFDWIEIYLKMYVMANLETNELESMLKEQGHNMTVDELIVFSKKIDFENLLAKIKSVIQGR